MGGSMAVIAGIASTLLFAASALPMVVKAARTRDMDSYSLGHLVLSNVGNLFHTFYVFSLPPGPIWVLHTFYLVTAAFMLAWYLRHARRRRPVRADRQAAGPSTYTGLPMARRDRICIVRPMPAGRGES